MAELPSLLFICSSVEMADGVPQGAVTAGDLSHSDTTTIHHANPEHGRHIQAAMMGFTAPRCQKPVKGSAANSNRHFLFKKCIQCKQVVSIFMLFWSYTMTFRKKEELFYLFFAMPGFIFTETFWIINQHVALIQHHYWLQVVAARREIPGCTAAVKGFTSEFVNSF